MIKRSLKNASYMFLSVMVAIALSITITYAAFTSKAVATGTITFETMYNIVVAKDGTTNLGAPTISFTNKLFDGSASAVISLSETSITATSLNDGTINGNFTKYAWQIAGSNLDSTNLHYSVYARTDYTYYPALKVVLQYNGSSSSIDGVHLSVKDAQSVGQMYDEESTNKECHRSALGSRPSGMACPNIVRAMAQTSAKERISDSESSSVTFPISVQAQNYSSPSCMRASSVIIS